MLSLRVAVPSPRGQMGARERNLPPVCPRGEAMATRRLPVNYGKGHWEERGLSLSFFLPIIFPVSLTNFTQCPSTTFAQEMTGNESELNSIAPSINSACGEYGYFSENMFPLRLLYTQRLQT